MLELHAMARPESVPSVSHTTFRQKESSRFLGTVQRKMPHLLEGMPPEARYILFAASDYVNPTSFPDLERIFDVNRRHLRYFYGITMVNLWVETIGRLTEEFSIDEILQTAHWRRGETTIFSGNTKIRMSDAKKRHWQDPEYRKKMVESRKEEWRRPATRNKRGSRVGKSK